MNFWNYLGMACLLDTIFGRRKQADSGTSYNPKREAELDERYNRLSDRIDAMERRLDGIDPDSELYDDLDDDIEMLRGELYEMEDERYDDEFDDY